MNKIIEYLRQFKTSDICDNCKTCPMSKNKMRQLIGDKVNDLNCYHRFSTLLVNEQNNFGKIELAENFGIIVGNIKNGPFVSGGHCKCQDMQYFILKEINQAHKTMETE